MDYESLDFLDSSLAFLPKESIETISVCEPGEKFGFLHEAAIIEFEGVLYTSWYHNTDYELTGYTPICGKRSFDHGKTWTDLEVIADDLTEKILYCPPVYGICDGNLYMLINEMVSADHIHGLDLYRLNKESGKFEFLWSRPIAFKLNTNVVKLPNEKLLLPGRMGELDGFPNTPAVLISDSGKIDASWRLVKLQEDGNLEDGVKFIHPEISVICCNDILYMFCRNDMQEIPLVYLSKDYGESWSVACSHDIPIQSSKIYCGTLSDGRNYLIANIEQPDRSKLAVYFSEKNSMKFTQCLILFDKAQIDADPLMQQVIQCHYPSACEYDGMLYIIATKNCERWERRGAVLYKINLKYLFN